MHSAYSQTSNQLLSCVPLSPTVPRAIRMRFLCITSLALLAAMFARAEDDEQPPSITYGFSRSSSVNIKTPGGVFVGVDKGIEWKGVKVYLSLTHDLLAVDAKTDAAIWSTHVSAYWNVMTFKQIERGAQKSWAVELRPHPNEADALNVVAHYDLKTGEKIERPGEKPSGKSLTPIRSWQGHPAAARPFFALVSTAENYAKVNTRLHGKADPVERLDEYAQDPPRQSDGFARPPYQPPAVDFSKEVVLVYNVGDTANSTGVHEVESFEDDKRILLRVKSSGFQTMNCAWYSRDYSMFVLPRSATKAYVLEHDDQSYINGPPIWKEHFRIDKLGDPAKELAAMPPPPQPVALPNEFKREIKHFKSDPPKGELSSFFSQDEYDYYLDAAGKQVLHGTYKVNRGEQISLEGAYADGLRHGEWRFWSEHQRWQVRDWPKDAKHPTHTIVFDHNELHGMCIVFNKDGVEARSGSFDHGEPHGRWISSHPNGKVHLEATYDRGLLNGVQTRYSESGAKIEEIPFVKGQAHGTYQRWYENGKLALKGECVAGETPPPLNENVFSSSDFRYETHGPPCYRHGTWIRYANDGKELWRGDFNRGTGTIAEYRDDGKLFYRAQIVKGARLGKYEEWNKDGQREKEEQRREDGSWTQITYHPNGKKSSQADWKNKREAGIKRWWDPNEKLIAECEYQSGRPWNGTALTHHGQIERYLYGKASEPRP